MNSLRYAASIGLGLAGLTFAAVVCVGSSGTVHRMPAQGSLFRLAGLVAGVCFVTHTLCLWRLLGQANAALHGSTQRTQSMIDALSDGVLILDSNDRIVLANRTVAEWTGRPAFALAGLPADVLNLRSAENEALKSPPWRRNGIAGNAPTDLETALGDDEGNVHLARLDARQLPRTTCDTGR